MKSDLISFFVFCLGVLALFGWVANILALINDHMSAGMLIVRAAGIFIAPLGAILGFI
jgi:hypothetical protein